MIEQFIQKHDIGLTEYAAVAVMVLLVVLLIDQVIHFKPKVKPSPQMELNLNDPGLNFEVMPHQKNKPD
jgi:hypothetical protein